jgi:ribosome-associated toxin RatA of RatAB toxin-antitoxin module
VHILTLLPLLVVAQAGAVVTPDAAVPCVACRANLEGLRAGYTAADWNALTRGEIVTAKKNMPGSDDAVLSNIESSALLPYPAPQIWEVLVDFESRPKYIPGTKEVRILRVDGNRVWLAEHLRIFLVNIRYQVIDTLDPEHGALTWVLDKSAPHDIADTMGSWQLAPVSERQQTLVRYRVWIDSGQPVPRLIEEFLTWRSLPKLVGGLRTEVQRRYR